MTHRMNQAKEEALVAWAKAGFGAGVPVIWDKQDALASGLGPRRDEITLPYATLGFLTPPIRVGLGVDHAYKELDTWTITHKKQFTLTVKVFAKEEHLQLVQNLIDSLDLPTKQLVLQDAGLSYWGNEAPVDLSELLDTKHQLIAACDFLFAFKQETDDEIGEVQSVVGEGTFDGLTISIAESV